MKDGDDTWRAREAAGRADVAREQALRQAQDMARLTEQLVEAQRLSRLKDEFLATVSHELRAPLQAIVGWAYILKQAQLDPATTRRALDTIIRSAEAQARLVGDLLEVSRIVAGKVRLERREIDLAEPIEAAVEAARPGMDAKGVRLRVVIEPGGGRVFADPYRLQQIVSNLLSNAVRFAPRGGLVEVRLSCSDAAAEITVEDDGPGIPPEFLPHVFEPFRQADPGLSSHPGLGLGLAIARHLVELHGGRIEAENRRGAPGALFRVRLPRGDAGTGTAERTD